MSPVATVTTAQSSVFETAKQNLNKTITRSIEPTEVLPLLVRADAIAARTPWTRKHVYDLAKRRRIPHYRFEDGSVAFDPIKVKDWLDSHEVAA